MSDPWKASFRWGDPEVDSALKSLAETEEELVRILSSIPSNTPMYKYKSEMLETCVWERIELEKVLYNWADYDKYYKEKVIDDQKKDWVA